ncbi:hypothetical protein ACP275_12G034700 [Erythranthe tilingii]
MKDRQRWQPEEDALLRAYVKQYGPKEWSLISQRMGKTLDRDPKSCLERWKNYLKPGIKKGSLTAEEQHLVISLQAKYGNKWKKIAAEVPGRTAKRLGKWWEVFKEKQLKHLQRSSSHHHLDYGITPPGGSAAGGGATSPEGKYDHILETFAEKYVQPNLFPSFQSPTSPGIIMPAAVAAVNNLSLPDPPPNSGAALPPWLNMNSTPTTTSSLTSSSSSTTPSPSVSLTLSPSEAAAAVVVDPIQPLAHRFNFPIQQVGILIQHCKELEEGRENLMRHKKEATWRLSRVEQQLEAEKARRKREKTEEVEERIRRLREEEAAYVSRMEAEYRDEMKGLHRDAEAKEDKLMEEWCSNHVKLVKLLQQIGGAHPCGFSN